MTIIEEGFSAARGLLAIILGKRDAPGLFDLSQRGLVTSAIVLLLALALSAFLPALLLSPDELPIPAWKNVAVSLFVVGLQFASAAGVLTQLNRMDGFIPYVIVDNWVTFYAAVIFAVLGVTGAGEGALLIFFGVLTIVIKINISRIIVTLSGWQIVGFLGVQLVATLIGMLFLNATGFLPFVLMEAPTP